MHVNRVNLKYADPVGQLGRESTISDRDEVVVALDIDDAEDAVAFERAPARILLLAEGLRLDLALLVFVHHEAVLLILHEDLHKQIERRSYALCDENSFRPPPLLERKTRSAFLRM